jgi:hypothetical protein
MRPLGVPGEATVAVAVASRTFGKRDGACCLRDFDFDGECPDHHRCPGPCNRSIERAFTLCTECAAKADVVSPAVVAAIAPTALPSVPAADGDATEWQKVHAEGLAWLEDAAAHSRVESAESRHAEYRRVAEALIPGRSEDSEHLPRVVLALLDDIADSRQLGRISIYHLVTANARIRDDVGRASCIWCHWSFESSVPLTDRGDGLSSAAIESDAEAMARITRERRVESIAAIKAHVAECPSHPMRGLERAIAAACAIIETGDQRLLAGDGPAGGQPPELSLAEWKEMYDALDRARTTAARRIGVAGR